MKRLLILLLLVSGYCYGQTPAGYVDIRSRYKLMAGMFDSSLRVPVYQYAPAGFRGGATHQSGQIAVDTVNNKMYFLSGGAWREINNAGVYPTWQQTLTAGSTLTGNNTIDVNGNELYFSNADVIGLIGGSGSSNSQVLVEPAAVTNVSATASGTSDWSVSPTTINIRPHLGDLRIDTLAAASSQNTLMGWTSTSGADRGKVGSVTIGGNITLSSGTLTGGTATTGGTGQTTVTTGDLLYGSATDTWSKLAGVATGNALISGGVATAPSWGKIGLTTHVSGTLPIANGGTNNSSAYTVGSVIFSNGTSLTQDNSNFFWDDTNNRLGVGTPSPATPLHVVGVTSTTKIKGNSSSPSISADAGAGTSPTVSLSANSTDIAGEINLTTDGDASTGALVTVTFSSAYSTAPFIVLTPSNNEGASIAARGVFVTSTTTSFTVSFNDIGDPFPASTPVKWHYHVIQ